MSQQLISRSPDLQRLRDEGYEIDLVHSHLVLRNVPYVGTDRELKRGTLVSELTLAGDRTAAPSSHIVFFAGEQPCRKDGSPIQQIFHEAVRKDLGGGLIIDRSFSNKPTAGYPNYFEKMSRYVEIISAPAISIDDKVTAKTFRVVEAAEHETPFYYLDTASSRAGISAVTAKLQANRIAIVGLGGTGAYVLDLLSKTPVRQIHLFDGDIYLQHNAFRTPGAPSVNQLREAAPKVHYFEAIYSKMHRGITAHHHYLSDETVGALADMDFVFVCIDNKNGAKKLLVQFLEQRAIPFIDVGMGVQLVDGMLSGILRVTTSTDTLSAEERQRISFGSTVNDDYSQNIQIADLNALNAALAVIRWKKLQGFYLDLEREHHSTYTIDGNLVINEDRQ